MSGDWQFWVDRGGTFTDVVGVSPQGEVFTRKLLSVNPRVYDDAALYAVSDVIANRELNRQGSLEGAAARASDFDLTKVDGLALKVGTTIGTNALLERKGVPVLFVTTKGFKDALRIGYQARPKIFALKIELPEQLYSSVLEVDERVSASGEILREPDRDRVLADLKAARKTGLTSCAIAFVHGFRFESHERLVAELAREAGFEHISLSSQVCPLERFVSRGDTTLADAYLSPLLSRYVRHLKERLPESARLYFMQSNGGLVEGSRFSGKDSVLSGPAGGIVGAVKVARAHGFDRIISFDMGGTSTDVSHFAGEYEHLLDTTVAGVRLRTPMLDIHTVAAGGGSILRFDGGRLVAGPESAGAQPGPMCYREGGPLTVTDANLILGKIQPDLFPAVFGDSRCMPVDSETVQTEFTRLAKEVSEKTGKLMTPEQLAGGFVDIACTKMANAIKHVSTARGHDVRDYVLVAFGGAGGQHACLIAEALGIDRVLISPYAGVLSACGIGLADLVLMREKTVNVPLGETHPRELTEAVGELSKAVVRAMSEQAPGKEIRLLVKARLKYTGTDSSLSCEFGTSSDMLAEFTRLHMRRYGFTEQGKPVTIELVSVTATGVDNAVLPSPSSESGDLKELDRRKMYSLGKWHEVPVYKRDELPQSARIEGPCIIAESTATTIVEPLWTAEVLPDGCLLIGKTGNEGGGRTSSKTSGLETADPVQLELFNNLFMFIAEQMGFALQNTSHSVNIKERLDFSCALFDAGGNLVANAPHMPVHLGSMGESVQSLMTSGIELAPGDVYAINDPYAGGTHLPDITVISPVFFEQEQAPRFFVASRGHHADIGGKSPGSMPSDSTTIYEEGVLLRHFPLVLKGVFQEESVRRVLGEGEFPARNPEQNILDLKAQIAANAKGSDELTSACHYWGADVVTAYMEFVQDYACEAVRRVIDNLESGGFECLTDDGAKVVVKVDVDRNSRSCMVDFTGTSGQHPRNLNAPYSVCKAAVLYVFRTLVSEDIPLNAGCFRPLHLVVPEKSMLNPEHPAAVVAGNVETSQIVVDALYGALGALAASQGTMNNLTFGNDRYQYYETICGGAGAGPGFDGTDAVHTHMTNSRLTDPEVLESRFPVRLESFEIRVGSGGGGKYRGGDGTLRKLTFCESMSVSILSDRRRVKPHGLSGGTPAACGRNYVLRNSGTQEEFEGCASFKVEPGEALVIETPGGGGFGG